ncbi:general odorant-binding protein 67-like [Lutzomyia longipalpis]|uniref:general odorant-binding protein 67-like n=1 Tax=Lutzomyia longipalpis TaxID=7200 RepID=UPI00248411C1|nr:general odorant-binding protein 67-like [Lutzomyia longipalpis]
MFRIAPFLLAVVLLYAAGAQGQDCRDLPPLRINPKECCRQPKLIDDSVFARCFENFGVRNRNFQPPPPPPRQGFRQSAPPRGFRGGPPGFPSSCIAECVFNSTNLSLDDPKTAADYIGATLQGGGAEWIPIFVEGFATCTKAASEKLRENDVDVGAFDGCSPLPGAILACLHSHVFTKCPQNVWKNAPGCDQLRDFFTACPLPPMF